MVCYLMETNVPASVKVFLAKIGESLKSKREDLSLSREDICRNLKMHINYVIALEEGLYEDLPSAASFFASLRSYSRFLGLDANSIIEECKNNKFLNESFMGLGLVERKTTTLKIEELPNIYSKPSISVMPKDEVEGENRELLSTSPKESKNKKAASSLIVRRIFLVLAVFLFLSIISLGIFLLTGSKNITNTPLTEKLSELPFMSGVCKQFVLEAKEESYVKVKSIALGDWIIDRKVFPGEKIKFSDSKGIKIETDDPSLISVKYAGKKLDLNSLEDEEGNLTYKCY